MFPIPFNFPFRKKDGSVTTMGDAIGNSYTLPTASASVKGGVKIGANLSMDGDVLNASGGVVVDYENDIVKFGTYNNFEYYLKMDKRYIGDGNEGYEIVTTSASGADASIDVYSVVYENGVEIAKTLLKHLVYSGDKTYEDENITVTYGLNSQSKWFVSFSNTMYKLDGELWTSPISWAYHETVDHLLFTSDPS